MADTAQLLETPLTKSAILAQTFSELTTKIKAGKLKVKNLAGEIRSLEEDIFDATASQKKGLTAQLRDLTTEKNSIENAIKVVIEKRKSVYLSIYQEALDQAKLESLDINAAMSEDRKLLQAAMVAKRNFSKEYRKLSMADRDRRMVELEVNLARALALSRSNQRANDRAKNYIRRAEADLELAKVEVSKWE